MLSPEEAGQESSVVPLPHPQLSGVKKSMVQGVLDYPTMDPGGHTDEILRDYGIGKERIQKLRAEGVFGDSIRHSAKL